MDTFEVGQEVAFLLSGAGRFHIDDAMHARIDAARIQRTGSFQRHGMARIAQGCEQRQASFLRQRFAARDAHVLHTECCHLRQHGV